MNGKIKIQKILVYITVLGINSRLQNLKSSQSTNKGFLFFKDLSFELQIRTTLYWMLFSSPYSSNYHQWFKGSWFKFLHPDIAREFYWHSIHFHVQRNYVSSCQFIQTLYYWINNLLLECREHNKGLYEKAWTGFPTKWWKGNEVWWYY